MKTIKSKIAKLPLVWECQNDECNKKQKTCEWDNFSDGTPVCECGEDMVYLGVDTTGLSLEEE